MQEIRVAIIGGAGFMGYAHSLGWALAPIAADAGAGIRKVVVVEADEERATSAARRHGWEEWSTDWREVIARDDIDVIDIVTPPGAHAEVALAAIAAGKHVFVEKPISNQLDDAVAMESAAAASGVVTQVGFNYRYTPAVTFIKRMLEDGTLGEPLQFRAHYVQDVAILGRVLSGWRASKSAGGSGVVGDIGSHIIDLAEFLVGDITSVNALVRAKNPAENTGWLSDDERIAGDRLDDAAIWMAQFENGAIGSFATTVYASGRKNRIFFELECSKGLVEFDWNRREEVRLSLVSDPADQQGLRTVIVNENHEDVWWPIGGMGVGYVDGTAIQLQKFVRAIVGGGRGAPDFNAATHVQKVITAVLDSGDSHEWIEIDSVGAR
jgi:predicted dehydrogenase